ncbi:MAG: hypothetical protein QOG59_361, partial [Solirubrobacteraceae bacterium]|nr:hypothetical protein [Solirubrobacteraceae bacterium]
MSAMRPGEPGYPGERPFPGSGRGLAGPADTVWPAEPEPVRRSDECPLGICDGSGFTYDEAT